jgi:alkylated DNA repair protein (DNA oxidative demethylase)
VVAGYVVVSINLDLFASSFESGVLKTEIAPQAWHLAGFVGDRDVQIKDEIDNIIRQAPLRQMKTPEGQLMSVRMTSCGDLGWVSDQGGYRYQGHDPLTDSFWPKMSELFRALACRAAEQVGFKYFQPDSCLINSYSQGTRLSLHQDKDEGDFSQPIVSVSLGLPVTFIFGGLTRSAAQVRLALQHGDIVVWGGESRLAYHGVLPLAQGQHPLFGRQRINLTFRCAKRLSGE